MDKKRRDRIQLPPGFDLAGPGAPEPMRLPTPQPAPEPAAATDAPVPPPTHSPSGVPAPETATVGRPSRRRRGVLWFFWRMLLGLIRLALTAALVMGLIGGASYFIVKSYVGGPEVQVPNVLGVTVEEALEKAKTANLFLELDRREFSEAVARGNIMAQAPAPGVKVKQRTPIRIVVSDGSVRVRVPNVVGLTEIKAGVAVRSVPNADLDIAEPVARAYSPTVKRGDVIAQDPPAGVPIIRGARIKILVSLGPYPADYNMPDLRHRTVQEARAVLGAMQLTLGEVREVERPGAARGVILDHHPGPGSRVSPGAAIALTIASGLEPAPQP